MATNYGDMMDVSFSEDEQRRLFNMVVTHGALPPEVYWKSVLPNTAIPKAVTDVLHPDWVNYEKGRVNYGSKLVFYGKGGDDYGKGGEYYGKDGEDYGKGGEDYGKGREYYGKGGEDYEKGEDDYGKGGEYYGKGGEDYGKEGENYGKGGEYYGKGGEDYGKGGEYYGKGGENYGKGGEYYGKGREYYEKGGDYYKKRGEYYEKGGDYYKKRGEVCYTDTSQWNPKHLAFQVLKVKPETVLVRHFLPEDHVVWKTNNKSEERACGVMTTTTNKSNSDVHVQRRRDDVGQKYNNLAKNNNVAEIQFPFLRESGRNTKQQPELRRKLLELGRNDKLRGGDRRAGNYRFGLIELKKLKFHIIFAAAFRALVGGVLFALEEITSRERDTDRDGKVNFKEFFHGLFDLVRNYDDESHNYLNHSDNSMDAPARVLFGQLDKDVDGYLSDAELLPIVEKLHPSEHYYAKQQADYIISQDAHVPEMPLKTRSDDR
ncbi:hypothetical protein V8G54_008923 [Vigna mungo]|uniref:Uncharacterized protein n=1 Tax=Vigna mungo TaxID=3915 RepID=A0AAQ3SAB3_VIGMU